MSKGREESLKELVTLVDQDLKNGATKEDTVNKLITCGVQQKTAEAVVNKLLEKPSASIFRRFINLCKVLSSIFIFIIFVTFIIADEGDQWSLYHLLATLIAAIPLLIVFMVEYVVYGFGRNKN